MGEEKREPQPGYWAVLPAPVRYDEPPKIEAEEGET